MFNPFVSIIIPVYNGSNYLKEALESAFAQTYGNFEVIVVNDGSTDSGKTEAIALSYGDRIRYFAKPNGGVASALNLAIREMRGEYFSWLSHDDWYYPNKLQAQIEALQKFGDPYRIVYSNYNLYDQITKSCRTRFNKSAVFLHQMGNSVFSLFEGLVHGCSMLLHKSHFERVGFFNEDLPTTQDYDLCFRLFRNQKLLYLPEPLIVGRSHPEQGCKTINTVPEEERLYRNMIDTLSTPEITTIYPSRYHFYSRLLERFRYSRLSSISRYALKLLQKEPLPQPLAVNLQAFRQYIESISPDGKNNIYIFGAGVWGHKLYHELTSRLIKVNGFCDNYLKKIGHVIDNKYCISFEDLKVKKNDVLVLVANADPAEIVAQLEETGFPYIATRQQLEEMLFLTPPVKWMGALDGLEEVNYSLPQNQALIGELKATLRDICAHYFNLK